MTAFTSQEMRRYSLNGLCYLQDPNVGDGAKKWFASWKSWLPQNPSTYFETNGWCMESLKMISEAFTVSSNYIQAVNQLCAADKGR